MCPAIISYKTFTDRGVTSAAVPRSKGYTEANGTVDDMSIGRAIAAVCLALAVVGAAPAWADHGHGHGRVHFGVVIGPLWGPWFYPPPPYYYYPPVVIQQQPPVYIEQQPAPPAAAPQPQNYWYFCADANKYYPYVKECPGGWQRVAPQPPTAP